MEIDFSCAPRSREFSSPRFDAGPRGVGLQAWMARSSRVYLDRRRRPDLNTSGQLRVSCPVRTIRCRSRLCKEKIDASRKIAEKLHTGLYRSDRRGRESRSEPRHT